jgi:hypothetical protein
VGIGYEKAGTAKQMAISALYELGPWVFGGLVQNDDNGYGANLGDRTNMRFSVAYNFGANELHLNMGTADDYSRLANSGARQATLGFNHNLSKRTKVYTYYTKIDAERATPYAVDFSSLAFGVRHNF